MRRAILRFQSFASLRLTLPPSGITAAAFHPAPQGRPFSAIAHLPIHQIYCRLAELHGIFSTRLVVDLAEKNGEKWGY